jgi:hypothetical protein
MAFYTNDVQTEIFDAVFDSSKYRSQFNLTNDKFYMSNLRLLNVGLTAVENTKRYNLVNGVGAVIKNITLYSDNTIIDKVVNFSDYSAFQQYNKTNQANSDVSKLLMRNGLGFVFERAPRTTDTPPPPLAPNSVLIKEAFPNAPHVPSLSREETVKGFLNLRECFPILRGDGGLKFLHTGLMKNMKLVIEYMTAGVLVDGATGVVDGTTQPILVADSVADPAAASKFLSEFKSQQWVSSELESVVLPLNVDKDGATIFGTQFRKFRLTGAEGKIVNSLLIQKKGSTAVSTLYDSHGSETMIDEAVQLYVNGAAHLPEQGVVAPMQRLALLHDSFGVCNAHTCSSDLKMYLPSNFVDNAPNRCGRLDWFGCIVNKRVSSLDLDFSRSIVSGAEARYSQAITLNVFYGVVKALVKTANGFEVVYV